ncbi:uncharacterized protein Z518_05451 [Rhinocladiella mackenziei CBS 650.93]|uniref:Zn(2)-C6 fungal-type domain-containing protein n=1 Tax=Rhinocladiella mackenziei CBS 650.93 TaxID=1442369 RepID=A0A0D2IN82_9EURO|nr:uncharacterized protein Z518_05451 [Rhinocladiella mackenziei CBS 650.93]KIX04581.1 hypothetical protein Z518_05451 [Rhinocladiella mackenziei CBS 650.93]
MSTDKARTKKWAPKTFNGCLTCKYGLMIFSISIRAGLMSVRKRRIKCDEGKPACQSGYAPPKIRLFEPASSSTEPPSTSTPPPDTDHPPSANDLQFQTYLRSYPHPRELALVPTFGTEEEQQAFQFFLEKTADLISVYSQPYFWTVLLPQATWHQPAIKHSIIALASLHQFLTSEGPSAVRANHSFMFHYNTAIHTLVSGKPPIDVVLASCVIFWALENFNGGGQPAFDHMKAAIKIVGEWKAKRRPNDPANDVISTYIEPTIKDGIKFASKCRVEELQSQMSALSLSTQDMRVLTIQLPDFDTLEKAGDYLGDCIQQILVLKSASPGPDLVESINDLDAKLYKWMNMFQGLPTIGRVHQKRMLIVHNVAAYVLLDQLKAQARCSREPSESHRGRSSFIVVEVEDVLSYDPQATEDSSQAGYPNLGFIPPVFLVAVSSAQIETRRKAIRTLRLLNVVEGPWSSETAAKIAEAILEIAHHFSILPSKVEWRHMLFNFEFDRPKNIRVLYMRWKPEDERFRGVDWVKEIEVNRIDRIDCVRNKHPPNNPPGSFLGFWKLTFMAGFTEFHTTLWISI